MLLLAVLTINYALENLLCDVTGLISTAGGLFIKNPNHISLAANQVLLPAYGFIYANTIKKCFFPFSFLKDVFSLKSFRTRENIFCYKDYSANH